MYSACFYQTMPSVLVSSGSILLIFLHKFCLRVQAPYWQLFSGLFPSLLCQPLTIVTKKRWLDWLYNINHIFANFLELQWTIVIYSGEETETGTDRGRPSSNGRRGRDILSGHYSFPLPGGGGLLTKRTEEFRCRNDWKVKKKERGRKNWNRRENILKGGGDFSEWP